MPLTKHSRAPFFRALSARKSGVLTLAAAVALLCALSTQTLHAQDERSQDEAPKPAAPRPKPVMPKPPASEATPVSKTTQKSATAPTAKPQKSAESAKTEAAKSGPVLPPMLPNVVVLDAAHGGDDSGARIGNTPEKDVNQQIATRIRSLLQARTFDVKYLRDGDTSPSPDQRAGQANQARATACIVVHSAPTGDGVRIYTSALNDTPSTTDAPMLLRWNRAQAPYVEQSRRLAERITAALTRSRTPAAVGRTFTVPIDSMQCPTVLIEVGPTSAGKVQPTDTVYQQTVADAVAGTLMQWRDEAKAVVKP